MTKLHELFAHGQSIWSDFVSRSFIASGELQGWLDKGVRGVTSNPTILMKAVSSGSDYDKDLERLANQGLSAEEICWSLVQDDIARAADVEYPLWQESNGGDGFVSIEVNPRLAHDTAATIAEAHRLHDTLNRPNVMVKVPATPSGIPAIETLIADGININITLIFGRAEYKQTMDAYMNGLEKRVSAGSDITKVASVASLFVSRLDTLADPQLGKMGATDLQGKVALANAKLVYRDFLAYTATPRWKKLLQHGARVQRPLWASTGTKNPNYPDTMYVDNLVGANTVNTAPLPTIEAILDHGSTTPSVQHGLDEAETVMKRLAELGINLQAWTDQLLREGVESFSKSYGELLDSVEKKRTQIKR